MANIRNGNTFYIDAASSTSVNGSYIEEPNLRVKQIIFVTSSTSQSLLISDKHPVDEGAGSSKISLAEPASGITVDVTFPEPVIFPNGIWINSISSGATVTMVITREANNGS